MVQLVEVNDRFQRPLKGGYSDISLSIRVSGMLCELQLNLKEILAVKNGAGHSEYEEDRMTTDDLFFATTQGDKEGVFAALAKHANATVKDGKHRISALQLAACAGE